ncbi:MAG: hypothetical protein K0S71_1880 [Clostridia bacterium]|jgi:hypothetical protein|nr:hypothetical protein [Clostridia bacterium]
MGEITKKSLVLTFGTVGSKEVSLTITKPADGLTGAAIAAAMDQIVSTNAYGDGDVVNQKLGAKYVTQQVNTIILA